MPDVVTIGESMLRLAAGNGEALEQARSLRVDVAGAESNLAIGLKRMGLSAGWISRLVDNPLGQRIANELRAHGVDISRVIWAPEGRVGTYYLEPGRSPRPAQVIYDRIDSAITFIDPAEVDWEYVSQAKIVHLTGIIPALSPSCRQLVEKAIQNSRQADQLISFDVNYRSRLWTVSEAGRYLASILPGVNLLLCGLQDARALFDLEGEATTIARTLTQRFNLIAAVITDDGRGAFASSGDQEFHHPAFPAQIIDPIGAGDAFAAGFITGYLESGIAQGLVFGNALAALKLTFHGDVPLSQRSEVEALVRSGPDTPAIIR